MTSKSSASFRGGLGMIWEVQRPKKSGTKCAALVPMHAGMSYARLEGEGLQWPCYDENHPGEMYLHARLWERPVVGPLAPFSVVEYEPPVDELDDEFPIRLTTGRRLDSYNTGVQTGRYASPLRFGETVDLSPDDCRHLRHS